MKIPRRKKIVFNKLLFAVLTAVVSPVAFSGETVTITRPSFALPGEKPGFPFPEHIDQFTIHKLPVEEIIMKGKMLFEAEFNRLDGVGANLKEDDPISTRFARVPRSDTPGYFSPKLKRPDGPTGQNCRGCHIAGRTTGTGNIFNEGRDRYRTNDVSQFINRNPAHLFGSAATQLLAEQSTEELYAIRDHAIATAKSTGIPFRAHLITSNKIDYGYITAQPDGTLEYAEVKGIRPDLWVRAYHLKATMPFLRAISSTSTHFTIGMQGPEVNPDPTFDEDLDGVTNEFTAGDQTAMTLYQAALPRPVSKLELHEHVGGKYTLTNRQISRIKNGQKLFSEVGCASCHAPKMILKDPIFREPSDSPMHRYSDFGMPFFGGGKPEDFGLDWKNPVKFDITNNPVVRCESEYGKKSRKREDCWQQFERTKEGYAIVRLYSDQKRYDMGPGLSEPIDEFMDGASTWRSKELWGLADSGPWLHDGRATTIPEAIWWHGGEAQKSRDDYFALSPQKQEVVIEFLESLVFYNPSNQ